MSQPQQNSYTPATSQTQTYASWLQTARKRKKPPSFIQSQQTSLHQSFSLQHAFGAPAKKLPRVPVLSDNPNYKKPKKGKVKGKFTSRYDSSLGLLTKKFLNLLREATDNVLDLNYAADHLGVQKRRIYDITNVLEGVGLIEKKAKNHIRWRGSGLGPSIQTQREMQQLRLELDDLAQQEVEIDRAVDQMKTILRNQTTGHEKKNAFVTYEDIRSLPSLEGETLIAVRAPSGTTLSVPDPQEGLKHPKKRYQIFVKSHSGPIDVYLLRQKGKNGEICNNSSNMPSSSSSNLSQISNRPQRQPQHQQGNQDTSSDQSSSSHSPNSPRSSQASPSSWPSPAWNSTDKSATQLNDLPSPVRNAKATPRRRLAYSPESDSALKLEPDSPPVDDCYYLNMEETEGLSDIYAGSSSDPSSSQVVN